MRKLFKNAVVFCEDKHFERHCVLVSGGKIAALCGPDSLPEADETVDCGGMFLTPGFIDIHIHGREGFDCSDNAEKIAKVLPATGVTSFLPTLLTMPFDDTLAALGRLADYIESSENGSDGRAEALGIHSEGIYFSPVRAGAQNPKYLRKPDVAETAELLSRARGHVKIFALAPELEGARDVIAFLAENGVRASMGHTDTGYAEILRGVERGLSGVTHIYNGMSPINHLECGAGGAVAVDELYAEVIADGFHVNEVMLKVLFRTKPADKILMISDNVWISGLPAGSYELAGLPVKNVGDRLIVVCEKYSLAGSCLSLDRALTNVMRLTGAPPEKVLPCLTSNPAVYTGVYDRKGSVTPGKDADINLLTPDFTLNSTYIKGNKVK